MIAVNIINPTGFTPENMVKVTQAQEAIQKVFNSDEFKNAILDFTFDGDKTLLLSPNYLFPATSLHGLEAEPRTLR
jgi:hypothetical protein